MHFLPQLWSTFFGDKVRQPETPNGCERRRAINAATTRRWGELFDATFDVLLYNLTGTYFETDEDQGPEDLRQYGYLCIDWSQQWKQPDYAANVKHLHLARVHQGNGPRQGSRIGPRQPPSRLPGN